MGNRLCNCSFLDEEKEQEENISQIQNQELSIIAATTKLKGKSHYFYINSKKFELITDSDSYNNPKKRINQIYILNRLKFLSKKIRQFLLKRRTELTFGTLTTANNEDNNRLTVISTNKQNYLNTDTGDIAFNNLGLIKIRNYTKKNLKKYFKEEEYSEEDGILYLKKEDNTELEGIYYNNAFNGFTRIFFPNGEQFKGELFDDEANGFGIYNFSKQGCKYKGYWENNYKNGIGKEKWWYNDIYKGEFSKGKKNGIGIYNWKDGSSYQGEWLNNNIHGWGIFNSKNKRIYSGHFIMNKMNGYGEMVYLKNKGFFYGYWKDNKKNGFGVEFSPRENGEDKIYAGFFKDNERFGYGILFHKNEDEENIMALWKKNKIIKSFRNVEDFFKVISQNGFDNYLFFFKRSFGEHIRIINNIKNDKEENE